MVTCAGYFAISARSSVALSRLRVLRCTLATSTIAANNDLTRVSRLSSRCISSTRNNSLCACAGRSSASTMICRNLDTCALCEPGECAVERTIILYRRLVPEKIETLIEAGAAAASVAVRGGKAGAPRIHCEDLRRGQLQYAERKSQAALSNRQKVRLAVARWHPPLAARSVQIATLTQYRIA